jgi:hypothetical protein
MSVQKNSKKTNKTHFEVGFLGGFFLGFIGRVFLGGFFIANPDYQYRYCTSSCIFFLTLTWLLNSSSSPSLVASLPANERREKREERRESGREGGKDALQDWNPLSKMSMIITSTGIRIKREVHCKQCCGSGIRPFFDPKDPGSGIIFLGSRFPDPIA